MQKFVIVFEEAGARAYAGFYKGAAGFAPTVATAIVFDSEQTAASMLGAAYPDSFQAIGRVEEI